MASQPPSYSWLDVYDKVCLETDRTTVTLLIGDLEAAIFVRFQELKRAPDADEREMLIRASDHLLRIKKKLGWPGDLVAGRPN
jgi:hypothetical protein